MAKEYVRKSGEEVGKTLAEKVNERLKVKNALIGLCLAIIVYIGGLLTQLGAAEPIGWKHFNIAFAVILLVAVIVMTVVVYAQELHLEDLRDDLETEKVLRRPKKLRDQLRVAMVELREDLVGQKEAVEGFHVPKPEVGPDETPVVTQSTTIGIDIPENI